MITLLLVLVFSGKSFDVTPEVCTDVRVLEQNIYRIESVAAAVAESNVKFEPVHTSTKWPNLGGAHVEQCQSLSNGTQNYTHFKCVDV